MNSSLLRISALIGKESRQILRDPSSILIAFVLPAILLMLFGYGINMDAQHVPLGVALESDAPAAHRLMQTFNATRYFEITTAADRRELTPLLTEGKVRGLIVIPGDFANRLATGSSPVLVITDGSETNTANFVRNYSAGVLNIWQYSEAAQLGQQHLPPVQAETRFWYNPEQLSRNNLIPGSIAVIMAIVGTLLTSLVVAREWERGTMEALLSTPVTPFELLISKAVPYFVLGFCSLLGAVAVVVFIFQVPYRGSLFALTLAGGTFLLCALGQGLLISTATKNQFVASQAALVSGFLPAFLLSGFIFDINSMPWLIRQLTHIIPARDLVTNLQTLFLVGDIWAVILPNILFLLIIAALFLRLTLRKTPSRLEHH